MGTSLPRTAAAAGGALKNFLKGMETADLPSEKPVADSLKNFLKGPNPQAKK